MVERDERSKEPGFCSHHIATRFCVLSLTLKQLRTGWRQNASFGKYFLAKPAVTCASELNHLRKVESEFFGIALQSLNKHFTQLISVENLPFMIGLEKECATIFARYFLKRDPPDNDSTFNSEVHKTQINLCDLIEFVSSAGFEDDNCVLLNPFLNES